ncbi:CD53 molecule isoform X1 [Esox lucius]|uniref:CD53 molecule isoform X1 n=1 Tax=Esox lucius TaxID=8010 RepID=UPI000576709B|nr:CD53 molecule isoform X1 [Esox lucius]
MAQNCLKCLKYTMCVVNLLCFMCGMAVFGFGVYMMTISKVSSLIPTLASLNVANLLFIIGIIITCVSFLGFLGALKENRCLLIAFFVLLFMLMLAELAGACLLLVNEEKINNFLETDLKTSLKTTETKNTSMTDWDIVQKTFMCCGVFNASDWKVQPASCCKQPCDGCYTKLKKWFDENLLTVGVGVIVLCIVEVLGMCFSMTLFCHISRSGLGYKL